MMSRNSCSKGLVRDCMKRNLWAIVLSTVGFFMAQLLPVIMTAQHSLSAHKQDLVNLSAADAAASWQGYVESVGEMLGGQNVFVKLAVIILAVTCGVSISRTCTIAARWISITACRFRAAACSRWTTRPVRCVRWCRTSCCMR